MQVVDVMDKKAPNRRASFLAIALRARTMIALAAIVILAACSGQDVGELVAEGAAHARAGNTAEALAAFERALAIEDDHPGALYNAGLAALLLDQPERGRAHLEKLVAFAPDDGRALHLLARARMVLGDGDGALDVLRRSVQAGFVDLEALNDDLFAPLRNDLRFVQLVSLAAQRGGQQAAIDDRGRMILGGTPVSRLQLPGEPESCGAPAGEEAQP